MYSRLDHRYYERELKYLAEEGKAFAERFPEIARYLHLHGTRAGVQDPHAERIVEAFAFLTGKLERYMEAQFPELTHALFHMLYPRYLQHLPCKTLARFHPRKSMLDKPVRIPRGTELFADAQGPDKRVHTYTTCWDVTVQPLDLARVYHDPEAPGDYTLSAELEIHPGADSKKLEWDSIEFALHGEPSVCRNVFRQLAENLENVTVKGLPRAPLELVWSGFARDHHLGGPESGRFAHLDYLRDYFAYPPRFFFFQIKGIDQAAASMGDIQKLQIDFRFKRPFASGVHVNEDHLAIHSTIAQNLFPRKCEPFKIDPVSLEYQVLAHAERADLEVHTITRVTASKGQDAYPVRPYFHFEQRDIESEKQWFYTLRHDSGQERGWNMFMRFIANDHQGPGALEGQTVSVEALCSNRHFAQTLNVGELDRVATDIPETITVRNLTQASAAAWPPLHSEKEWDFLAHLALDHVELGDLSALKTLLRLYHVSGSESGERKIKGFRASKLSKDYEILRGCCIQGQRLDLEVDGAFFPNLDDVALLTRVLGHFLEAYCPINGFLRLAVRETQTGETFTWMARG